MALVHAPAPDQHEVGLQLHDALEVDRVRIADDRQRLGGFGVIGEADHADQRYAAARGKGEFGQVRAEAHDALGRRGEHDGVAAVVGDTHLGLCSQGREPEQQGEQPMHRHAACVLGSKAHCAATRH